jgi:hypothetical protein
MMGRNRLSSLDTSVRNPFLQRVLRPDELLDDVLTVLLTALDSRARNLRGRPGLSAIFLLNNVSYIRREVLGSQTGDQLGETCEDTLNKKMRSAKVAYLDIWSPLVSTLLDAGIDSSGAAGAIKAGIGAVKGGGDKRETKDRFVRFFNEFEEIESLHQVARLDEGEVELRERLKGEVARMLIPSYTKFFERHRNGDFSKSESDFASRSSCSTDSSVRCVQVPPNGRRRVVEGYCGAVRVAVRRSLQFVVIKGEYPTWNWPWTCVAGLCRRLRAGEGRMGCSEARSKK